MNLLFFVIVGALVLATLAMSISIVSVISVLSLLKKTQCEEKLTSDEEYDIGRVNDFELEYDKLKDKKMV